MCEVLIKNIVVLNIVFRGFAITHEGEAEGSYDLFEHVVKLYWWRKWGYSSRSFAGDYTASRSIDQSEYIFIGCITLQMNCRAGQSQLDV